MNKPTLRLRPSSTDRAMICPGSVYPKEGEPLIEVVGDDDASAVGQAAHKYLALYVRDGVAPDIIEIATEFKIELDQFRFLCYAAREFFETVSELFDVAEWQSETRLKSNEIVDDFEIEGTSDLLGITEDRKTIVVGDLKTGRSSASHEHQLRSYAKAALDESDRQGCKVDEVVALIGWARDGEIQKWSWSRADLEAWVADLVETVFGWDGVKYTVGEHCTFCRRHASCEARNLEMRSGYKMMVLEAAEDNLALEGERLAAAWEASKLIPKVIEQWRARIKERIRATGAIDLGNGKVLDVVERNAAPEIDTAKAAAILKDEFEFTDEDVLSVCKLGKKDTEDIIGSRAARGQKGKEKKRLTETLKDKGALVAKTALTLTVKDHHAVEMVKKAIAACGGEVLDNGAS